jgi:hypothetical protein
MLNGEIELKIVPKLDFKKLVLDKINLEDKYDFKYIL